MARKIRDDRDSGFDEKKKRDGATVKPAGRSDRDSVYDEKKRGVTIKPPERNDRETLGNYHYAPLPNADGEFYDDYTRRLWARYGLADYTESERQRRQDWASKLYGYAGEAQNASAHLGEKGWTSYTADKANREALDRQIAEVEAEMRRVGRTDVNYKDMANYAFYLHQLRSAYDARERGAGYAGNQEEYDAAQKLKEIQNHLGNTGWNDLTADSQYTADLDLTLQAAQRELQQATGKRRDELQEYVDWLQQMKGVYNNRAEIMESAGTEQAYLRMMNENQTLQNWGKGKNKDEVYQLSQRYVGTAQNAVDMAQRDFDFYRALSDDLMKADLVPEGAKAWRGPRGEMLNRQEAEALVKKMLPQAQANLDKKEQELLVAKHMSATAGMQRYDDLDTRKDYQAKVAAGNIKLRQMESKAEMERLTTESEANAGNVETSGFNQVTEDWYTYRMPTDQWNDKQRDTYAYLLEENEQQAYDYAISLNTSIMMNERQENMAKYSDWAHDHPFWGRKAGTAAQVLTSPLGFWDYMGSLVQYGNTGLVMPRAQLSPRDYANALSGGAAQQLNELGTLPDWVPAVGGKGAGDLYQLGNSVAESLAWGGLSKGILKMGGPEVLGAAVTNLGFFGNAASETTQQALERGATPEQALTLGFWAGFAEAAGETLSVEHLIHLDEGSFRKLWRNIRAQGLIEGSEEFFTTLLNTGFDALVMGDKSELNTKINELMYKGMNREDATRQAWKQWANDIAFDTLGGILSGGLSASVGTNPVGNAYQALTQYKGDTQGLFEQARLADEGSDTRWMLDKYQKRFDKKGNISNLQARRLQEQTRRDLNQADKTRLWQDVRQRLESQMTGKLSPTELNEMATKIRDGILEERSSSEFKSGLERNVFLEARSQFLGGSTPTGSWLDTSGYKTAESRAVAERRLKSVELKSGERVEVKRAKMDGGKLVLTYEQNGEEKPISQDEANLDDYQRSALKAMTQILGQDAAAAYNKMTARNLAGDAYSVRQYAVAFANIRDLYGGKSTNDAKSEQAALASPLRGNLTDAQVLLAYSIGKQRAAEGGEKTERPKSRRGTGRVSLNGGVVDGMTLKGVKDRYKVERSKEFRAIRAVARALHIDVVLFESEAKNEKGELEGIQGAYQDGVIYLDWNAGMNNLSAVGDRMLMRTMAHELTHFIQQNAKEDYAELRDFVEEYLSKKMGKSFNDLVLKKMQGRNVDYDGAMDEVVADACETMLRDSAVVDELMREHNGLWGKIRKFVRDFLSSITADDEGAQYMQDAIDELRAIWDKGLRTAVESREEISMDSKEAAAAMEQLSEPSQKIVESLGEGATMEVNKAGEMETAKSEDGHTIALSMRTYNEGGKEKLIQALKENGHTQEEIDAVVENIEATGDFLEKLAEKFADSHDYQNLKKNLWAGISTNLKTGKQVISTLVNNGDYPINLDLQLICKKRVAYMRMLTRLIDDGVFEKVDFKGAAIADLNKILRDGGFETACLGCFVESRRLQLQAWAETIVEEWNAAVDKRNPKAGYFNFASGGNKLSQVEIAGLITELEGAGKKNDKGNLNLGRGSVEAKMGRLQNKVKSLQQHLTVADLLTPQGMSMLRTYDQNLFSLVKQRYGAASPKIVQDFNPYNGEIADLSFKFVKDMIGESVSGVGKYKTEAKEALKKEPGESKEHYDARVEADAMRRYLYAIGGVRIQSFSDFMIENVFDYMQIVADLSARELPLHGYSKEAIFLRLFGMTGAKLNGSLIAHVEPSMGKEYAGLLPVEEASNGRGIVVEVDGKKYAICFDDYARHAATGSFIQSIGMKDIVALQLDPRYSKNVGSITIGVSNKQILAMLDSPYFRMVIPYHASGMIKEFAELVGVASYNDYTKFQTTRVKSVRLAGNAGAVTIQFNEKTGKQKVLDASGKELKVDTHFDFNEAVQRLGDAKAAADEYLAWCADDTKHPVLDKNDNIVGYASFTAKFSDVKFKDQQMVDFTTHPNYYKLLEDFNSYDSIGEASALQGAVTMTLPSEATRLTQEQMAAYKQALRDTGLYTEKEIAKYAKKADMTFQELIAEEVGNRADYESRQAKVWDETVDKAEKMLLEKYGRETNAPQLSVRAGHVEANDSDETRAKILKSKKITAPIYEGQADASVQVNLGNLESQKAGLIKETLLKIAEQFDIPADQYNDDYEIEIKYSNGTIKESSQKNIHKPQEVAKVLPILSQAVKGAIGIESHDNRYYYDTDTIAMHELLGGYYDGTYFVPVLFGVKQTRGSGNTLYVIVGSENSKTEVIKPPTTSRPAHGSRSVEFSITDIIKNVKDADILEYLPDPMLDDQQKALKYKAIADTIKYTADKNDKKYAEYIRKGRLFEVKRMVQAAAKAHGYTIKVYHGTTQGGFTIFRPNKGGIFTTDNRNVAGAYADSMVENNPGSKVYELYARPGKQFVVDAGGSYFTAIPVSAVGADLVNQYPLMRGKRTLLPEEIARIAAREGYDSVRIDNVVDPPSSISVNGQESGTDYIFFKPNDVKSAEPITYDDNGNVIPLSQRFDSSKSDIRFSTRGNVGYHAGDLGKAEFLKQQGRYRGTGHFGTGTYFVGVEEKVTKDSHYGKRPQHAVDFSDYNLYKVRNDRDGYKLHDALKIIDGGIKREWINPAMDEQFNIINPTGYYDLARSKYGEEWAHGDNLVNAMREYAADNGIKVKTLDEFKADEGKDIDDSDVMYYYEDYVKETVKEEIGKVNEQYHEFRDAIFDMNLLFGFKRGKIASALKAVADYQDVTPRDARADSYATVFMKNMGYDGVNVNGTGLDNTAYGSVIYDVKPSTVLYSVRSDNKTDRELLANAYQDMLRNEQLHAKAMTNLVATKQRVINQLQQEQKDALEAHHKQLEDFKKKEKEVFAELAKLDRLVQEGTDPDAIREQRAKATAAEERMNTAMKKLAQMQERPALQKILQDERQIQRERTRRQLRENINKRELRKKVDRLWKDLNRRITSPTEKKNIPVEVMQQAIEVLQALNMDTSREGSKAGEKLRAKLDALNARYRELQNDPDYRKAAMYDAQVAEFLQRMTEAVGDTPINKMSYEQLETVYNTLQALDFTARRALKLKLGEVERNAYEVSMDMTRETRSVTKPKTGLVSAWLNAQLSAERMFRRLGNYHKNSVWEQVYRMLDDGQLKQTRLMMEGSLIFEDLLAAKDYEKFVDPKNTVDLGLQDENGNAVRLTHGMMVSLWMHLQNEQNRRHVAYGGLTIPGLADYYKGNKTKGSERAVRVGGVLQEMAEINDRLRETEDADEIAELEARRDEMAIKAFDFLQSLESAIEKNLSAYDRQWIEACKEMFDGFSKRVLNETTMEVYGIKRANVENYFPIWVDGDFLNTPFETVAKDMSLENAGFMKERVDSSKPIRLADVSDVAASQIRKVSQYAGLMPVVRDFNKIWGKTQTGYRDSLRKAVHETFGQNGVKYIENLMADLNGARGQDNGSLGEFFDRMRGHMAQAALTLSLRTAMGQAASYPTAASVVGWKALHKAFWKGGKSGRLISRADKELIRKWSPLLYYRMKGYRDTELGNIAGMNSKFDRIWKKARWATGWIQAIDGLTVGRLWYAAEYYVQDHHKDLAQGSDAYYEEVAKVFNDIVEKTQPNYSVMQRPDILRNPNALVKQLTMFLTQRLQNFNILYDACATYSTMKADYKAGRNGVTREDVRQAAVETRTAVLSQVAAAATIVAFKFVADLILHSMNAYRDDDDEELTAESVSMELLDMFLDSLAGNVLGGSEVYDLIESKVFGKSYYGISLSGVETVTDLIDAVSKVYDHAANGKYKDKDAVLSDLDLLAKRLGPVAGIPYANAKKILLGGWYWVQDIKNGEFLHFEAGVDRTSAQQAARAVSAYEQADSLKIDKILAEVGVDKEKTLRENMRKQIKQQYQNGEISFYEAEKRLKEYGEASDQMMRNFINAEYEAGHITRTEAAAELARYGGMTAEAAEKSMIKAAAKQDTGLSYNEIDDMFQLGNLTAAEARDALVKYGLSREDASLKVEYWDYQDKHPGSYYTSEERYRAYVNNYKPLGFTAEMYESFKTRWDEVPGEDKNHDGKADPNTKKYQRIEIIDSLPLSSAQKDALFNMEWKTGLEKTPWHKR